jgi:hypothetical protein
MADDEKLPMVDKDRLAALQRNLRDGMEATRQADPEGSTASEWFLLGNMFAVLDALLTELIKA